MRQNPKVVVVGVVVVGAAALWGCASRAKVQAGRVYPAVVAQREIVDIHVFRRGTSVSLTNTTARAYGPSTLWLNRYFAREVPGLAVGETVEYDLRDFKDEHGGVYRAGGFFSAEPPKRLVAAQLELAGADGSPEVVGLIVVQGEGD